MSIISEETIQVPPAEVRPLSFGFIIIAGIILPLAALIVELSTKLCANEFFDPVPSLWHVLMVGFVPLANGHILWALYRRKLESAVFLSWVSAIAAGAAIFYSLLFLPISPIAVIGIIYFGLGLLPLSPMFALWATLLLRRNLLRQLDVAPFPLTWPGLGTGLLIAVSIIGLSELRFVMTRYGLEKAASEDAAVQNEGLNFLRKYGNDEYILQFANSRQGRVYISDLIYGLVSRSNLNSKGKSKEIFYRLTGKTPDSTAVPGLFNFGDDNEERFWREKDVTLISSQMDGSIDNDASLGYLEWTITLKNKNQYTSSEGFTQIQLPSGALVSRLTLWINGEEREAAFAEKNRVTEAYNKITQVKRDPVLITTAGRDRINLKCFPITPKGGEMKMRIGITFPLVLENETSGLIRLPYFRDKNFQIPTEIKHAVWLESKRELQTSDQNLRLESKENLFAVRGLLSDAEITDSISSIRAVKSDRYKKVWAKTDDGLITQEVSEIPGVKPAGFIFVVDTSAPMQPEQEKIAAAIRNLPADSEVSLVLTNGNGLNKDLAVPHALSGRPAELVETLEHASFGGGTDNLPALIKAWDLADQHKNSVIIWLHSPQPYKFSSFGELAQRLQRRPDETTIYSLSKANGFDEVEKQLDGLSFLQSVPRFGDTQQDLERLIYQLNQSKKSFGYTRLKTATVDVKNGGETSNHLVRLWAGDEVNRLLASESDGKKAVELAVKNQIVTSVTGAVVLERQQQYDQFGLRPVDKNTVPTIPEPEFYLLLAVVTAVLICFLIVRKLF